MPNRPRRQQYRRQLSAAVAAASAVALGGLGLVAASLDAAPIAAALFLAALGTLLYARHWLRLAGRSRVGARSEEQVRRALAPLVEEGWRLLHGVPIRGHGDVDHVAISPAGTGLAFAIETKTRTYRPEHLVQAAEGARWLTDHKRRWCPRGAIAVLCVAHARGVEHIEGDVLVVSIDRLPATLRAHVAHGPGT